MFWGTALGHFSQCVFSLNFRRRSNMVSDIFTPPPTIKKLPTALNNNIKGCCSKTTIPQLKNTVIGTPILRSTSQ